MNRYRMMKEPLLSNNTPDMLSFPIGEALRKNLPKFKFYNEDDNQMHDVGNMNKRYIIYSINKFESQMC